MYGMTEERAARIRKNAIIMHPGPMNRGLEIDPEVADGQRSVVLRQVALGVAVRMAALGLILGS
jgi:aspartate carbamoyltransferase catalytic subunit